MKRRVVIISLAGAIGVACMAAIAFAAAFFAIITPTDLDGWTPSSTAASSVTFVAGPGMPPSGDASLEYRLPRWPVRGEGAEMVLDTSWDGLQLRNLGISYWTYGQSGRHCDGFFRWGRKAVYLVLDVDTDDDGEADDQLIYQPAYNGRVECDTWQNWNAAVGLWYSVHGGTFSRPGRPLAHYVAENPGAKIAQNPEGNGIRLAAGYGNWRWSGFIGNADELTVSSTEISYSCEAFFNEDTMTCEGFLAALPGTTGTYDFELVSPF